jgi:hypothetical protein
MKSAIFIFILLCKLSLSVLAQGETKKTEAYKVDEAGIVTDCDLGMRVSVLKEQSGADPSSKIVFLIYKGITRKVTTNYSQIHLLRRKIENFELDKDRTIIQEAGFREKYMVEFWIVPEGAEMPKPTNVAEKIDEIGKQTDNFVNMKLYGTHLQFPQSKIYLVNTGKLKERNYRTKQINRVINLNNLDSKKITIIDGGYSKNLKTEFWILKK